MSGFGTPHVWRGVVPATGVATWTSISGALPDIPVNAVAVRPVGTESATVTVPLLAAVPEFFTVMLYVPVPPCVNVPL